MADSLSDRLITELIEGCQELCEDIGCLPKLLRYTNRAIHLDDFDNSSFSTSSDIKNRFRNFN